MEVIIVYASTTGTTQTYAQILRNALKRHYISSLITDASDLTVQQLLTSTNPFIFLISTIGQGEVPISLRKLWKTLLRRDLPSDLLDELHHSVFSFGDSSYTNYNWAGKLFFNRLQGLGANSLIDRGEGDDQTGYYEPFHQWTDKLAIELKLRYSLPSQKMDDDEILPPSVQLRKSSLPSVIPTNAFPTEVEKCTAKLIQNKRITASSHWQDTRHIIFQSPASYQPGDVCFIYPTNPPFLVERFLSALALRGDDTILYEQTPVSLYNLAMYTLDIQAIPTQLFFDLARHFTENEEYKEKFIEFTKDTEELYSYTSRPRRNIVEVLEDFELRLPHISYILDLIPILKPRQFSIASSSLRYDNQVHLVVALVNYKTMLKEPRKGVFSRYIEDLAEGTNLIIGIGQGAFNTPSLSTPIILVGPGTGISPLRGMIQERIMSSSKSDDSIGQILLFFGCRSRESDLYFQDEWKECENMKYFSMVTAFSRDDGKYVQYYIDKKRREIIDLLDEGACIYVCGNANKMAKSVREAFGSILMDCMDSTKSEKDLVRQMIRQSRYFEDVW